MVSCICCAWRMRFPSPPFIMVDFSLLIRWFHRSGIHFGAEALAQALDGGILLEGGRGSQYPVLFRQGALPRRRGERGIGDIENDANVAAQVLAQALQELVLDGTRAPLRDR